MAEAVGLAASILQIASLGLKVAEGLYTYGEKVATAKVRIAEVADNARFTSAAINEMGHIMSGDDDERAALMTATAKATVIEVVMACQDIFKTLQTRLDNIRGSAFGTLTFPFRDIKLVAVQQNLERLKSTLQCLMQTLIYAEMKRANKSILDLDIVKRRINELHSQAEQARQKQATLNNSEISLPDAGGTRSVTAASTTDAAIDQARTPSHETASQWSRGGGNGGLSRGPDILIASSLAVVPQGKIFNGSPPPAVPSRPPPRPPEPVERDTSLTSIVENPQAGPNAPTLGTEEPDATLAAFCDSFCKALLFVLCPCMICLRLRQRKAWAAVSQPAIPLTQHAATSPSATYQATVPTGQAVNIGYGPTGSATETAPYGYYHPSEASAKAFFPSVPSYGPTSVATHEQHAIYELPASLPNSAYVPPSRNELQTLSSEEQYMYVPAEDAFAASARSMSHDEPTAVEGGAYLSPLTIPTLEGRLGGSRADYSDSVIDVADELLHAWTIVE